MSGPAVYRGADLWVEQVRVRAIAERVGTPCYVYSRAAIEARWRDFETPFADAPHRVCYAVKANPSLAVLGLLAGLGSGFDIVSEGELRRVQRAGGDARKVVFSGVGKTADEMQYALSQNIDCFNVESEAELQRLDQVASRMKMRARVALRVNPDVDPQTHPYIATGLRDNKFGIPIADALPIAERMARMRHVELVGLDCHIGSQLLSLTPFEDAFTRLLTLAKVLREHDHPIAHLDAGGGLGVRYQDEEPPAPKQYIARLLGLLAAHGLSDVTLLVEPGRAIVGEAGMLLTRVEYVKHAATKHFAVVDSGMNDLLRPALYDAWHEIVPVERREGPDAIYDIVGPVCESADFLGRDRRLCIAPGDLLAVQTAGAYGASMGSNYNSRPFPPEVMVDGDRFEVVRERQTYEALWALEQTLEEASVTGGSAGATEVPAAGKPSRGGNRPR
ncbi:MAG: diaminopimelate decarboxylase [Acidiferrobacteraceae bacterium]